MNRRESDDMLAAEYALGTLRGNARLHFERRLKTDNILATQVGKWQNMLSGLDIDITPIPPPESVWKKIELNLPQYASPRRRVRNYIAWGLAAGLGALSLSSWFYWRAPELKPLVVLNGAHQGTWVVSSDGQRKIVRITPLGLAAIPDGKSLELWLIPVGHKPVSIGLVNVKGVSQFYLADADLVKGTTIAISLEPLGGSPSKQPTGPVLYSGELVL
ncbi:MULTISPECIES: anti-sigma factor [Serratia]|uniref:anti-sigma factor n=1 Tax=Serratia TaxID=613 RepID=UPI0013DACD15|nr:anti-sigma factor [Serratia marcescens]